MERVFVTGADGCLGAWVVRQLLDAGHEVVVFDLGSNDDRHRLVARGEPLGFERVVGDVTDAAAVAEAMEGADQVIHLAALQVPFCRADPSLGAAVNVVGTVNVFEAALSYGIAPVVYASSVAVYGAPEDYEDMILPADAPPLPRTLYGVYKVANEQTAAVYAQDHGLTSVGLRPHTIYGPGRDQGMTSQPTVAIAHAVRRRRYAVDYGGVLDFQYAPDVAGLFIAATGVDPGGASVFNVSGHVVEVADFVDRVRRHTGFDDLEVGTEPLALPEGASPDGLSELLGDTTPTPLDDGIEATIEVLSSGSLELEP